MMVAPGVFSVLAGMSVSSPSATMSLADYACPAAYSDGAGGPYPAQSSSASISPQVVIQVVPDASQGVGFAPSNVTVSAGTTVMVWSNNLGCTVRWREHGRHADFTGIQFTQPGDYRYSCQEIPNVVGVVHVE